MVKIWTWEKIEKRISPWLLGGYSIRDAAVFNLRSLEFIASAVYCRNYTYLQEQIQEFSRTVAYPSRTVAHPSLLERITRSLRRKKKCHINFSGTRAGVRCYCAQKVES